MCGIAGIFAYHYAANPVDREELLRIREHMKARGPDGAGEWFSSDGRVGLGHRRLAIIDLTKRAAQPFVSDDGRYVLVFNGEIYNHKALRAELEATGAHFRSDSDTEVILQMFSRHGVAMLPRLRGMFAIGIWDGLHRQLLLARDPYGIKPLYYANDGWTLRFASQVRSLLAGGKVSRTVEPAGVAGFYLLGSVPEPFTLYHEIRAVPAGSYLCVDEIGPAEARQYFSLAATWQAEPVQAAEGSPDASVGWVRSVLLDSVQHHLVADVPVGAFLSAGIDSSALVALMRRLGSGEIRSITLAFDEFAGTKDDEAPLAEETARRFATVHTTRRVGRAEFLGDLEKFFEAMDQPTIDGLNTWFVSKAAREAGLKVAVSGLGGDELFGGYPSFRQIPLAARALWLPSRLPGLGVAVRAVATAFGGARSPKLPGAVEYGSDYAGLYLLRRGLFMPWELPGVMGHELAREGLRRLRPVDAIRATDSYKLPPFARISLLESALYMRNQLLRDTDWTSMAHSLEVRVPYVDVGLISWLAPLLRGGVESKKMLLSTVTTPPLSEAVSSRPKTGFQTPIPSWLQASEIPEAWKAEPRVCHERTRWTRKWSHTIMSRFGVRAA